MTDKIALITGITGQDGSLLARLLLDKGYVVHGIKRRSSSFNTGRIDDIYVDPHKDDGRFFLHYGDMTDATNLIRILQETKPQEIYNLAAQSHVQVSFERRILRAWSVRRPLCRVTARPRETDGHAEGFRSRELLAYVDTAAGAADTSRNLRRLTSLRVTSRAKWAKNLLSQKISPPTSALLTN